MGCPGGMSTIRYTRSVFTRAFQFFALFAPIYFFKFSLEKDCMGKKDRCAVFRCNNDLLFFPEKYTVKFSFCPKSARKYRASAPWASHNTP